MQHFIYIKSKLLPYTKYLILHLRWFLIGKNDSVASPFRFKIWFWLKPRKNLLKGLSIKSLFWGNGDGALKVFGIEGIGDNLLDSSLSQIRRWEDIQWIFTCVQFPSPLPHCICSGLNPRLVETGWWRVYQGDIVLSPNHQNLD